MENTKIEWANHTFNVWEGCEKVSAGCANCYAERRDKQYHGGEHWGPNGTRKMMSEAYWKQPSKWNRDAENASERPRVFCSSLADVFEDRPELDEPRMRLLGLIERTDNLDWLLLTKRPENALRLIERAQEQVGAAVNSYAWLLRRANLWIGTTVENQEQADKRIPELLKIPAKVRFLSCEPLLGPLNLWKWLPDSPTDTVNWVIAGGESGPNARPAHPDWLRSLRDQCQTAGVAFHFKQWGEFLPGYDVDIFHPLMGKPPAAEFDGVRFVRVGKKAAGRLLDGRTWDELPTITR